MQPGYERPAAGERWNVNMPAVIGVVFVFLLAVVVWVIASAVGDDDSAAPGDPIATPAPTTTVVSAATTAPPPATSGTTTPAPMPATVPPTTALPTTVPPTTVPPTTAPATSAPPATTAPPTTSPPATAAPATTAPGSEAGTVAGDLGVPGRPMRRPACDGSYITVLASAIGGQATAAGLAAVLDDYPGSNYLRTDETCPSLTPSSGGEPIYVVFLGPYADAPQACAARSSGPEGAYARRLSDDLSPDHFVDCS